MFAVIQIGSTQFKVAEGDIIRTNRLSDDVGSDIEFDNVLMISKDKDVKVGNPYVKGAKVKAKVVDQAKGEKLVTLKYRRRKDSQSKKGHRQALTTLNITKISA